MFIEDWLHPFAERYRSLPVGLRRTVGSLYRRLPADWRYGSAYGETLDMVRRTEMWSSGQLQEMQLSQVRQLIEHAYHNVPYYRALFDQLGLRGADITELSDLHKVPYLTRAMVRQRGSELVATNIPASNRLYMNTGGSTGIPLELYYEKGVSRAREAAFIHALWRRVGWKDGDSSVMLRGWSVSQGFWQYEPIRNRLIMSAFHLNETNLPVYVEKMRDFAPKFVEAYPSNITTVARYMKKNKLPPIRSVKAILAGSENLFPAQRELLESVFECRAYSWYGHGELAALGGGCEHNNDYHMFPDYGLIELITESGELVTEPGTMGEIVATGFNNAVMPLIRYRTMDMGMWAEGPCPCGREYPRLKRVEGRKQELIVTDDGSVVTLTALIFGQHWHAFSHIERMQLVQTKVGKLTMRIVADADYSKRDDENEVRAKVQAAVGGGLELSFEYVDDIPKTKSGKHLFLVQELSVEEFLS